MASFLKGFCNGCDLSSVFILLGLLVLLVLTFIFAAWNTRHMERRGREERDRQVMEGERPAPYKTEPRE